MSEERKEKLFNKMYYDYLEREEAEEVIDYLLKLEEKNKQLQEENRQLKIENTNYKYKLMNGNSNIAEILGDKENDK